MTSLDVEELGGDVLVVVVVVVLNDDCCSGLDRKTFFRLENDGTPPYLGIDCFLFHDEEETEGDHDR